MASNQIKLRLDMKPWKYVTAMLLLFCRNGTQLTFTNDFYSTFEDGFEHDFNDGFDNDFDDVIKFHEFHLDE